jgi:hypothetical protein
VLRFSVALIGIGHLSYAAHGNLRSQVEHLACVAASQRAQIELPEFARLPSLGREKVGRLITTLERLAKQFLLLRCSLQLEADDQLRGFLLYKCSRQPKAAPSTRRDGPGFRCGK